MGVESCKQFCIVRVVKTILWNTIVLIACFFPLSAGAQSGPCSSKVPVEQFYVGMNGDISNAGRSTEGPVCVQVHYNRLRFNLGLNFQTTYSKGADLSSVLLTGAAPQAAQGGGAGLTPQQIVLNNILAALVQADKNAVAEAQGAKSISALLISLDEGIAPGKAFPDALLKNDYEQLKAALSLSQQQQFPAVPSDVTPGNTCPAAPAAPAAGSALAAIESDQMDGVFYGANTANVDAALKLANLYKCGGAGYTALMANIAILRFWDNRFGEIGLQSRLTNAQVQALSLSDFFVVSTQLNCNNIFNQASSTAASVTDYDESLSLNGNFTAPSAHQQQNFLVLTCGSPFAVSAGVEFSTIRAQEFNIVPSKTGGNVYGLSSNSPIHPLPIVVAHVRLAESADHRYALHGSAGVSGNLQGQNSGGSSAEFLMGPSVSFFRTMFVTAGVHIGTKSNLAGGFSVGDAVPSGTTTPSVTKSYSAGVGFAITFTKP